VHDVFHVSQLKKCLRVPEEQLPMEELNVEDLTYLEYLVRILETSRRITRSKVVNMCKVQWITIQKMRPLGKEKMNSEQNSPSYSQKFLNLEDEILVRG
jgi:homoserine trans-succinylase